MLWAWIKSLFVCPSCASVKRENEYLKKLSNALLATHGVMGPEIVKEASEKNAELVEEVVEQRFGG